MRSILVLLRSKAATPELEDKLTYPSGGKRVLFEYDVIRLWEEPIEPFLHGGIGLVVVQVAGGTDARIVDSYGDRRNRSATGVPPGSRQCRQIDDGDVRAHGVSSDNHAQSCLGRVY